MLVLSRQIGQAVVIDDEIVMTVVLFTAEYVELSMRTVRGTKLGSVTVSRREPVAVPHGVEVTFVRAETGKVRIGLKYPGDVRIARKENWDELQGGTEFA